MDQNKNLQSLGLIAADKVAKTVGSWKFVLIQSCILLVWVALNVVSWIRHWDPYPFILLNLFLSLQAAYTAPMILMSQNRQAAFDREVLLRRLDEQKRLLEEIKKMGT